MRWNIEHLERALVARSIAAERRIGVYWLGYWTDDDTFEVRYIGRSLTCLQRRLARHVSNGAYDAFVFRLYDDVEEVWRAECREYHLFMPGLDNKEHPNSPNHHHLDCPYCRFGRIDGSAEDTTWIGGEA